MTDKKRHAIIMADKWNTALCEAYGVSPDHVARVVVIGEAGSILKVYFDCYGDARLYDLLDPLAEVPGVEVKK